MFKTTSKLSLTSNEQTVGEEKVFELITNNVENIRISPNWETYQDISYRLIESNEHLLLHVIANSWWWLFDVTKSMVLAFRTWYYRSILKILKYNVNSMNKLLTLHQTYKIIL